MTGRLLPEGIAPAMPVEQCGFVRKCMATPRDYAGSISRSSFGPTPSNKAVAAHALRSLEEARAKDVEVHERNAAALANNAALAAHLDAVMKAAGIPGSWSEVDRKSRARYPKKVTQDAGYLGDIRRSVPVQDGFETADQTYARLKVIYDAFAAQAEGEAERAAAERQHLADQRKAERRANIELATIVLRYGLDPDVEWSDVLESLRTKDQRLDLAVAMQQTRLDWSDGPDLVHSAIGRFKVETDEDKDIANDILECLTDWGGDGRVFRDTAWSYDRLFQSVADQQLATDVLLALSRYER